MWRRVSRIWLLVAGVFLLGTLYSCTTLMELFGFSETVQVGIDGAFPEVSFTPDTVSVHPGDGIEWINRTNATITLEFGDAPVSDSILTLSPGETRGVRVRRDAATRTYKYDATLSMEGRTVSIDPYIDVQPRG